MLTLPELLSKIRNYKPDFNEALVRKAYIFAKDSHGNQKRHSGDLYFSHPIAVAEILIELKTDEESIATALLHDVVEDTEVTLEEIADLFGRDISRLVDGVTKLGKIKNISHDEKIAENFRKLTMAMSQDIRVLLVKLADRLHNMRTISYMPSVENRIRKARESIDIYAPLAGRIGLYAIQDELQEISFATINPEMRFQIMEKLGEIREKNQNLIDKILGDLERLFVEEGLKCNIQGREKKPYSIWMKMKKQNIGFHNIYDIMAVRIIVKDIAECYRALGVVNSTHNMIPGTFKDYISTPKDNGYQSLHLAILGPFNKKIEIQIRDQNMHEVSEVGVASHWNYKERFSKNSKGKVEESTEKYPWINELISLFENSESASEVLKQNKFSMEQSEVFCFTPTGDIFNLPFGATAIDFAYAVHSQVGNHCVSSKVNGLMFPLRHKLENGDQVEIITEEGAKPSPGWLQFAVTSRARSSIKSFIRSEKFNEYSSLGRAILSKFFTARDLKINDEILEPILLKFQKKSVLSLYSAIAEGSIQRDDVLRVVYPDFQDQIREIRTVQTSARLQSSLPIDGVIPGMVINYASCCNPILGDKIIGMINMGSGVAIHHQECSIVQNSILTPQRALDVYWKNNEKNLAKSYNGKIRLAFANKSGSLSKATSIIASNNINITAIKTLNRSKEIFEIIVDVEVRDLEHLEDVISAIRIYGNVTEAERVIG
jgi:guanosine-3',5'-bis(diphosphate) 3'-pyrophosphohydrolase